MNMSLHPIAEAVRSQGRNGDSMLVHMTPGEVAALQRMAEANGGTLTINPETGQPEAFFLASLLPTIAGALAPSLASAGGILGTLFANPFTTSLTVGGLTGLVTGDMQKGLMAGLGAYGGYGLGEALAGASTTMPAVTPAASGSSAAQTAIKAAATPNIPSAPGFGPTSTAFAPPATAPAMAAAGQNIPSAAGFGPTPVVTPPAVPSTPIANVLSQPVQPGATELAGLQAQQAAVPIQTPTQDVMSRLGTQAREMGSGIQSIVSGPPGTGTEFLKDNISNIAMAAAPLSMAESPTGYVGDNIQYYYPDFDPTKSGAARYGQRQMRRVVDGRYVPITAKAGGLMSMAEGGETEYKKTPAEKIALGEDAGGYEMSITAPSSGQSTGSGRGISDAAKGLMTALVPGALISEAISQGIPAALRGDMFNPSLGAPTGPSDMSASSVSGSGMAGHPGGGVAAATGDSTGSFGIGADMGEAFGAAGGSVQPQSYKRGGLKEDSFIIPADVLAALGNGSNNAGLAALNKMLAKVGAPRAEKIDGPGDGKSDSIPTSIEGKQPARVAKDEAYVPTEAVRRLGGGDTKKGAKKLYNLMARVRKAAHGTTKQQRTVNPDKVARG